jgi:hypothetical protein
VSQRPFDLIHSDV